MDLSCDYLKMKHPIAQKALYALLEVKDSDLRLDTVYQGNHAVDQGIHIGGTFSELIPLIALFYGGFIHVNVEDPTARESDIYVQSKGHGIAGMASVFSDFGFFDRALLENSRGSDSDLNGHPGPILPGVHIATGPFRAGHQCRCRLSHGAENRGCWADILPDGRRGTAGGHSMGGIHVCLCQKSEQSVHSHRSQLWTKR